MPEQPPLTVPPWEPPFAGSEAEHLLGALERLRMTFRWKVDGLDADGLAARLPSSTLTLGGLLKHLAVIEDHTSTAKLTGAPMAPEWDGNGWDTDDDWEFTSAAADAPAHLYAVWDGAAARCRARVAAALADGGLDGPVAQRGPDGVPVSLRRLLFDLVEEYGRHTGQADLLREAVDGRVGEDPPPTWRPPEA